MCVQVKGKEEKGKGKVKRKKTASQRVTSIALESIKITFSVLEGRTLMSSTFVCVYEKINAS